MILIKTAGRCAVQTPDRGLKVCTNGEIIQGVPECEKFLIQRGVAEAVDAQDYEQLEEEAEAAVAGGHEQLEEEAEAEEETVDKYAGLTVAEMKAELGKRGVEIPAKAKKDDLLAALVQSEDKA